MKKFKTKKEERDAFVREIGTACELTIHGDVCMLLNFLDLPQETANELAEHYNAIIRILYDWNKKFRNDDSPAVGIVF